MKIIFISPVLTMDECDKAQLFLECCINEIKNYLFDICVIENKSQIFRIKSQINEDTLVVMFNNQENKYSNEILEFTNYINSKNIEMWSVAINKNSRTPIDSIKSNQSFDVFEQLRCRNLSDNYIKTVGLVFARKIISKVMPNFYNDNSLLFVSHRRLDGEEIAAKLCDQLLIQAKNTMSFRDVTNVEVGEEAQDVIDSALSKSDVLIFIHTEESSKSKWIEKELVYAVLNNIPIVWIRVDNANESKLRIKPGDKPHIECSISDFREQDKLAKLVDNVLKKSFELIMIKSYSVYDQIEAFNSFCESSNLNLIEVDKNKMIYKLSSPRKGYVYPQRDINHYIQYFGRRYTDEDIIQIRDFLDEATYGEHKLYDSAILLSDKNKVRVTNGEIVEDNYEDFYDSWSKYINKDYCDNDIEIIISGSFPACNDIYKQSLYDAVNILSKMILKNGFQLTFGSHPTFQNIIFEIGKKFRPNDYKDAVKMFISKFFKEKYDIEELKSNATVIETEGVDKNLLKSLTNMRENMINRESVKALICLGGVIREGNINEGIDEEIRIARENNIPVFVVGSVGGRSSQIASEHMEKADWSNLNNESYDLNEELALSLDYRVIFKKLINIIKNHN